jgi:hypothetical protein
MDDVLAGFYTDSETQGINRCRLYLQVECLSDICTPEGVRLDPGIQGENLQSLQRARFSGHVKVFQAHARGQYGAVSSKHTHAIQRPIGYVNPWARGLNPTFGLGIHITTRPHKFSASKCLQQQLRRPAPKPLGTTIQPRSQSMRYPSRSF